MIEAVDTWHQVGAGGADYIEQLSTRMEHTLLAGSIGTLLDKNPRIIWEMAELGVIDFLGERE